jgi:hypothetical protein
MTKGPMMCNLIRSILFLFTGLALVGCGPPKHYGYVVKTDAHDQTKDTALLLHAVKNFPIKIISINGIEVNHVIRTSSQVPTYIELDAGSHLLGLSLSQGTGECGRVMMISEQPHLLRHVFEPGKVYLLQRESKYDSAIMCDQGTHTIQIKFYIDELPSLPYDDVRSSFIDIDLSTLNNPEEGS